jgi:hypothetical protein
MCAEASIVHPLELVSPPEPAMLPKAVVHGRLTAAVVAAARDQFEDTVSRFRPLARRRLRTSRPFFVLIRTRKPCVRRRRRLFG